MTRSLLAVYVLMLFAITASALVLSFAIAGHAAARRPISGTVPACPAISEQP